MIEIRKIDKRSCGERVAVMSQATFDWGRGLVVKDKPHLRLEDVPWDGIGTPVVVRTDMPFGLVVYRKRRDGDESV